MEHKNKRSQNAISLSLKNDIFEAATLPGASHGQLSKQFGLAKSTIQTIFKNKESTQQAIADGHEPKRARLRKAKEEDVEKALVMWIKNVRTNFQRK